MTKFFPVFIFFTCAFPGISRSEGVEWEASAGVLPQEANLGFRAKESPGSVLVLRDGVLAIETNDDASAWIELPVALPEPGARFVVEVDADAASQPGAAAIQIASGEKGVFSWLFDKAHLRVCTDAKNNHEYTAMDVTERHSYRYEIDGLDVVVSVDGNRVYSGRLDEPLIDPVLSIGDLSPGGGRMRVYRIKVDSGSGAISGGAETAGGVRIVRWTGPLESGNRWEQSWPEKADAIVVEAAYVAAAARQAQFFLLCEGEFGQRMVTAASGLASIAASDVREEKLFLKIPGATRKISLVWTASDSAVPFSMKSLGLIPVRTLAGNPHFERMAGWPDGSIGQSFLLEGRERLLGLAIPLIRCFDARAIRAQLSCTVSGDGLSERKFVQPAANIPQDYLGSAVFLSPEPSPVGPAVSFVMDPGIAESRFYGWYDYRYSSRDPFPSGNMSRGSRSEAGSDLTFHAFAGLPQS